MTGPTIAQLHNLADRAGRGPLTPDEITRLRDGINQLEALQAVARGYCPDCGRGDAGPTVENWETERRRAETAEARARELERHLREADAENQELAAHNDRTCEAVQRRDAAEAALARVRALADQWVQAGPPPLGTPLARWCDKRLVELNTALDQPAPLTPAEEARLAQAGIHTPGCDCGHDGMGVSWHGDDCPWRRGVVDCPGRPTPS